MTHPSEITTLRPVRHRDCGEIVFYTDAPPGGPLVLMEAKHSYKIDGTRAKELEPVPRGHCSCSRRIPVGLILDVDWNKPPLPPYFISSACWQQLNREVANWLLKEYAVFIVDKLPEVAA